MKRAYMCGGAAVLVAVVGMFVSGCFTISETDYPTTQMSPLASSVTNCTVALRGYEATVTEVVWVTGYETVYVPGSYGPRHYHPGGFTTVRTSTGISQERPTDMFFERAKNLMESSGYNVMANPADYIVEVKFSGPYEEANDDSLRALWWLCSIFTYDDFGMGWGAKMKIYDNHTGRLLFSRDYSQRYEVSMFSPIPLFGIACYDKSEPDYAKSWCLSALTDRVTADASAFLTGLVGQQN